MTSLAGFVLLGFFLKLKMFYVLISVILIFCRQICKFSVQSHSSVVYIVVQPFVSRPITYFAKLPIFSTCCLEQFACRHVTVHVSVVLRDEALKASLLNTCFDLIVLNFTLALVPQFLAIVAAAAAVGDRD